MRSPIFWFGGKGNMVKKILPYITEHREYIEPFFGGGSIFFAKRPAKVETINDLNSDVMNFFRVLRDESTEFIRLANLTPYSRELYKDCRNTYKEENDPVKRAWKWFVVARMSFGGRFGSGFGFSVTESNVHMAGACSSFLSTVDMLPSIVDRLKKTQIENKPAVEIIKQYTTENSLCYVDPPYVTNTRKHGGYKHEMTDLKHEELLTILLKTPGKVVLSGYNNPIYNKLLKDWEKVEFETVCHAAGKTRNSKLQCKGAALKHQKRTEVLWLNEKASKSKAKQMCLM